MFCESITPNSVQKKLHFNVTLFAYMRACYGTTKYFSRKTLFSSAMIHSVNSSFASFYTLKSHNQ